MALCPTTCESPANHTISSCEMNSLINIFGLQPRHHPRQFLTPDSRMTIFLGVPVVLFDCSFDRPQSAFSVFLDRLLEQQEPSFSQMADILGLANITEEALVVSRRRLVHTPFLMPRATSC
jgi:hypothetical protein